MNNEARDTETEATSLLSVEFQGARFVVLSAPESRDKPALSVLSEAERAVVLLAAQGLSDDAIARRRKVASRTVANQLASAFKKLGVGSRFELAASFG